jgi:16S rRNA (cytidine1402-2'-O)-methyltransferase
VPARYPCTGCSGAGRGHIGTGTFGSRLEAFLFEGFLPSEGKERKVRIQELPGNRHTFILYEAPHRLIRTLEDLAEAGLGERKIAVCRELTKKYEEVLRCTVDEALAHFRSVPPRGEFVLVIEGKGTDTAEPVKELPRRKRTKESDLNNVGYSTKDISLILSKEWNESKKTYMHT